MLMLVIILLVFSVRVKNVNHEDEGDTDKIGKSSYWKNAILNNLTEVITTFAADKCAKKTEKERNFGTATTNTDALPLCPPGFSYYGKSCIQFCYIITDRQPFPPKCPYPNFLPRERFDKTLIIHDEVWILARRNAVDGFGPFVWKEGANYGYKVQNYDNPSGNHTEKSCMISQGSSTFKPVSCNDSYPALCVYHYNVKKFGNNYCRNYYEHSNGYTDCIPHSLDSGNHLCYCERNQRSIQQQNIAKKTRDLFCEKLAEPISEMQNHLLVTHFSSDYQRCWFGLLNDQSGKKEKLKWTVSSAPVNYTYWAKNEETNFSLPFGAIKFRETQGWVLTDDDGEMECGICELQNDYHKKVLIHVEYIPTYGVQVEIKNPFELSDLYDDKYYMFCFAGPTMNGYISQVLQINQDDMQESSITKLIGRLYNYPIYYWCEGFQRPNLFPIYSNKILVHHKHEGGYEYAVQVYVLVVPNRDPYLDDLDIQAGVDIEHTLSINVSVLAVRVIKVLNYNQEIGSMVVLVHITTYSTNDQDTEYNIIRDRLNEMVRENTTVTNFTRLGRCDVCLPTETISNGIPLQWPQTTVDTQTLPVTPCIQNNGAPVIRKCEGNFLDGAYWSPVTGDCGENITLSEKTHELYDLLKNDNVTANDLSRNLSQITEDNQDITIMDIYLISEILEKLETFVNPINVSDLVKIVSNVMNFDANKLRNAQETLNCTDKILYSLDNILKLTQLDSGEGYSVTTSERLLVQVSNTKTTEITGIALRRFSEGDTFNSFKLITIYSNVTIESLLEDSIELATFLPKDLIEELRYYEKNKLVLTLFYSDVLFNEIVVKQRQANSRILGILIPDYNTALNSPIPVIFKPIHKTNSDPRCAHWNYGHDSFLSNIYGSWLAESSSEDNSTSGEHTICSFDHITHFALLMITGVVNNGRPHEKHTYVLNIITAVGATLSLLGIIAMFTVAVIFRNWRQNCSTKVLLNFSVAISLQMILIYAAGSVSRNSYWCTAVGVSLHYIILSEFCWMLTIAFLQYRKFVLVFKKRIPHLLAKACLFCWCIPLIPVIILLEVSTNTYRKNPNGLCYPSGKYFYLGVFLPVFVTVTINFVILVKIIYSVCHRKVQAFGPNEDDVKLQVVLGVFLFFLLGITWVFGLALPLGGGVIFSYLFCLTATFQGWIIFLFFLVMNQTFDVVLMHIKRICCGHQRSRTNSRIDITEPVRKSRTDETDVTQYSVSFGFVGKKI